jgi:hypothetical protein
MVIVLLLLVLPIAGCKEEEPELKGKQTADWLITKKLTVQKGGSEFQSSMDLDGNKLDLDADADTSITADTDDQIDVEISGSDELVRRWRWRI